MSEQQNQLAVPQRWDVPTLRKFVTSPTMTEQIKNALPKHIRPEQFIRVMLTTLQRNPKLADCTPASFLGALLNAAELGLSISGPLGHAHLVPYGGTCQLILGYQGKIDLAFRSGRVAGLDFDFACQGDVFDYERGSSPRLRFVRKATPADPSGYTPDQVIGAWASAEVGGKATFVVLTKGDIESARLRSAAVRSGKKDTPWITDYGAMAAKTAVHRLAKRLPLSLEIQTLIAREDAIDYGDLDVAAIDLSDDPVVTSMPERKTRNRALTNDPAATVTPPPTPEEQAAIRDAESGSAQE